MSGVRQGAGFMNGDHIRKSPFYLDDAAWSPARIILIRCAQNLLYNGFRNFALTFMVYRVIDEIKHVNCSNSFTASST
jgi:hypothetical protein